MIDKESIGLKRKIQLDFINEFINSQSIVEYCMEMNDGIKEISTKDYGIAYNNIVKRTGDFIKDDLEIDDVLSSLVIFEYLLWNGYLSENKEFQFSYYNRVSSPLLFGPNIIMGKGVCLNICIMLNDVLNDMGYESHLICCDVRKCSVKKLNYATGINRKYAKEESSSEKLPFKKKFLSRIMGNHAIIVVRKGNCYYGVDPTNLFFTNFTDFLKTNIVGNDTEFLTLKPITTSFFPGVLPESLKKLIEDTYLFSDNKDNFLTVDDVSQLYTSLVTKCENNLYLLNDFYDSNVKDIDTVCKKLKK